MRSGILEEKAQNPQIFDDPQIYDYAPLCACYSDKETKLDLNVRAPKNLYTK